jgi:glycogen operon protein
VEGETTHPLILRLRTRQARNFMAILLLSRGVPMILAGDEMLRTQRGNNNAYCQDNALGWIDWSLAEANADMLRFLREAIALRKRHPALSADPADGAVPAIAWHGAGPGEPQWKDPESRVLAFTLMPSEPGEDALHAVLNMSEHAIHATLPAMRGLRWHVAIDTWRAAPADIVEPASQAPHGDATVLVHAFSVVVLEGR